MNNISLLTPINPNSSPFLFKFKLINITVFKYFYYLFKIFKIHENIRIKKQG